MILVFLVSFWGIKSTIAFTGPSAGQTPGSGSGLFSTDANRNVGLGAPSSTPPTGAFGKVFTVASSSNPGISLYNLTNQHNYVLYSLNNGYFAVWDTYGSAGAGVVRLVINPSGYVGIATTTPGYALSVSGDIQSAGSGAFRGSGAFLSGIDPANTIGGYFASANYAFPLNLAVGTSTTTNLPQTLSVYGGGYFSGNVGIGTTAPDSILQIGTGGGGVATRTTLRYSNGGYNTGNAPVAPGAYANGDKLVFWDDGAGKSSIGIGDNYNMIFQATGAGGARYQFFTGASGAAGTEKMTITNAGNVGIGTTGPQAKLSLGTGVGAKFLIYDNGTGINSGFFVDTPNPNDVTLLAHSGGAIAFGKTTSAATPTFGTEWVRITNTGNVGVGTSTPAYKLHVEGTGYFASTVTVGTPTAASHAATKSYVDSVVGGGSGSGSFSTLTVSGTSTLATTGGNVGIGTTAPAVKFAVGTSASAQAGVTNAIINNGLELSGTYPLLDFKVTGGSLWRFQSSQTNGDFYLQESTTPRITLKSGGNIGIATSSPADKLDVVGNGIFRNNLSADTFYDQGNSAYYLDPAANIMPYSALFAGNVGIGTTSPGAMLELKSFTSGQGLRLNYGSASGQIDALDLYANGASGGQIGLQMVDASNADLWFGSSGGRAMTIYRNGNVGIGTTTPAAVLDVNGATISRSDLTVYGDKSSGSLGVGQFHIKGTTDPLKEMWFQLDTTNNVGKINVGRSSTGPYNLVLEDYGGNVGIGTSTPAYKLDVWGTGSFTQPVIVGTPTASGHAATKSYVDSSVTGAATQWTSTSTGIFYNSGNVGIGTTSPGATLDSRGVGVFVGGGSGGTGVTLGATSVSTAQSSVLNLQGFGAQNEWIGFNQYYDGSFKPTTSNTAFQIYHTGSNLSFYGDSGLTANTAYTPTARVTIQAGGNVGIATTTPADKLDVNGNGIFRNNLSAGIFYDQNNTAYYLDPAANVMPYSALFSANVGIGTTVPGYRLDINGDANIAANTWFYAGGTKGFRDSYFGYSAAYRVLQLGEVGTTRAISLGVDLTSNPSGSFNGSEIVIPNNRGVIAPNASSTSYLGVLRVGSDNKIYLGGPNYTVSGTIVLDVVNSNVGIGTTGPQDKLGIVQGGGVAFQTTDATFNSGIGAQIYPVVQGSGNSHLYFKTNQGGSGGDVRMAILNSGNVGIGTSTPAYKLDVWGTGSFTQPVIVGTPTIAGHAATKSYVDSSVTGAATQWTSTSTGIFYNSGNVGIGTTGPAKKLHVSGDILIDNSTNSTLYLSSDYYKYMTVAPSTGDYLAIAQNPFATGIQFGVSTIDAPATFVPKVTILNTGNVGIATSSPADKLDVNGNAIFRNNLSAGIFYDQNNTGYYLDPAANVMPYSALFAGNVGIGTTAPGAKLDVQASSGAVEGRVYQTSGNADAKLSVGSGDWWNLVSKPTSGANAYGFEIQKNGASKLAIDTTGNVGIGTTSPGALLHLVGNAVDSPSILLTGTSSQNVAFMGDISTGIDNWGYFYLNYNGVRKVTLDSNGNSYIAGNVGIGTSTPAYKLDVWGTGSFTQPVIVGTPTIAGHAATKSYVDSAVGGGGGAGSFTTLTSSATTTLATAGGNVGIGTTSPTDLLHVRGSGKFIGITDTSDGTSGINFRASDNSYRMGLKFTGINTATERLSIWGNSGGGTGDIEKASFLSSGNVGISTSTPADKLDVNGNAIFRNNLSAGIFYDQNNTGYYLDPAANVMPYSALFAGNVGIGTTAPGSPLDVAGNAKIRGAIILNKSTVSTALMGYVGAGGNINAPVSFYDTLEINGNDGIVLNASPTNAWRTDLFVASSTGNIGIGTTSPLSGSKLDVVGIIASTNTSNSNNRHLVLNGFSGFTWDIYGGHGGGGYFGISENAATPFMVILASSGNVGVGTSTPAYKLDVQGGQVNASGGFCINGDCKTNWSTIASQWTSTSTGIFYSGGNVGINIASPGTHLDVNGNIQSGIYYDRDNTNYYFDLAANTLPYSLTTAGAVGIRTTAPAATLDIAGSYYSRLVSKGNCTATTTVDWSAGNIQHCNLTGNATFVFSNGQSGGNYRLILKQGGTGSYTATWPASVRWGSGVVPTLTATVGKSDYVGFIYNGVDSTYDGIAFNANF